MSQLGLGQYIALFVPGFTFPPTQFSWVFPVIAIKYFNIKNNYYSLAKEMEGKK
jgi:hypothetical protein